MIENCQFTRELQQKIDATSNLREKLGLEIQLLTSIEPLLCGKGSEKICCDPGKKFPIKTFFCFTYTACFYVRVGGTFSNLVRILNKGTQFFLQLGLIFKIEKGKSLKLCEDISSCPPMFRHPCMSLYFAYFNLPNNRAGWNKRAGWQNSKN